MNEIRKIGKILNTVHDMARNGEWDELSNLLLNLDLPSLEITEIVAYARCTTPMRQKIAGWRGFISRAHENLLLREPQRGKYLLRGLIDQNGKVI